MGEALLGIGGLGASDTADGSALGAAAAYDRAGALRLAAEAPYLWNETTYDRARGNTEYTIIGPSSRTGTVQAPLQTNWNARGVLFTAYISVNPGGAQTLRFDLLAYNPLAATYTGIAFSTATAFGGGQAIANLTCYPGVVAADFIGAASFDEGRSVALPRRWTLQVSHSAAGAWTYGVTASLIL